MSSSLIRSRTVYWIALIIAACCTLANIAPAAEQPSDGKHFLWRVTTAAAPFYVLGSYHALRGSDYPLGREIDQAIHESKRFLFEISPNTPDEIWFKKLRDAAYYPRGVTLKQKLRPETYAYVKKVAKMRESEYGDIKPWAIAMFLGQHPLFHSVSGYKGVESYVMKKAGGFSQIDGLETVDEHIAVLSDMSDIEAEVMLLQTMVYADTGMNRFSTGVAAWKRGDTQGVLQTEAVQEREAPFLTWRLIDRRNTRWVPKIEAAIKSGKPTMVVVGCRHLCGPNNVIALLQKRGYKLEQL
jgi:uncharacterized protein YbaP (TraB family)